MSDTPKQCPICGGPIPLGRNGRERIFCSERCKSRGMYLRKLGRAAVSPKPRRSCPVCGSDTTELPGGRVYCCAVCAKIGKARRKAQRRLAAKERKLQGQCALPKPTAIQRRKCHDCGCPTSDYRCPACLKAWRQKHGVSGDADVDELFAGVACLSDGRKGGRSQRRG